MALTAEQRREAIKIWASGATLQATAGLYGVTRERIRQIVAREATEQDRFGRAVVLDRWRMERLWQPYLDNPRRTCPVCLQSFWRGLSVDCCSVGCTSIYQILGRYLNAGRWQAHRNAVAKNTLRDPHKAARYQWALRVLNGLAPEANRRYVVTGSQSDKAIDLLAQHHPLRIWRDENRAQERECPVCGKIFYRKKYSTCSSKCGAALRGRRAEATKRARRLAG